MPDWLAAIIIAVVEGLTEFIPVSSTGMMLLTKEALGLTDPFWNTFAVMIQLGAILAVVVLNFKKLWATLIGLPTDPAARWFAMIVLIAFLPSAIIGFLVHDWIKGPLFENSAVQCVLLIIGGVILLIIDRVAPEPKEFDPTRFSWRTALGIGLFQVLAIMPGVSRSGATIVGSMLMRVDKRAAAEFSFFLAIPTMVGAFVLDGWESRDQLTSDTIPLLALGFVVAFVVALAVIKLMLAIVTKRGFAPFGWLRIAIGSTGLALLAANGRL